MNKNKNSSIGRFSLPIKIPQTNLLFVENMFQFIPKISANNKRDITIKILLSAALGYLKNASLNL